MTEETTTLYPDIVLTAKQYVWIKNYAAQDGMTPTEYIEDMVKRFVKTTMPMTEE